jgi:putative DNA primase/helicase
MRRSEGYEILPAELLALPNWVGFKIGRKEGGRLSKFPIDAKTGYDARSNDPSTWCDFETALEGVYEKHYADCLGIRLPNGIALLDFDKLADVRHDSLVDECVREAGCYADYTVSDRGLHVLFKTTELLPLTSYNEFFSTGILEIFCERFCVMTCDLHLDSKPAVADLTEFVRDRFPGLFEQKRDSVSYSLSTGTSLLSDDQLITKALASQTGRDFGLLKDGHYTIINPTWSPSHADFSYLCHLAFWTSGDMSQMDRLYRASSLYRKKWEVARYRNGTLNKALMVTRERYSGRR